jgi:hypothetical protein
MTAGRGGAWCCNGGLSAEIPAVLMMLQAALKITQHSRFHDSGHFRDPSIKFGNKQ